MCQERGENGAANGNGAAAAEEKVLITGLKQACEQAMEALQAFVPCEETMTIPPEYHRFLIGTKGDAIRAVSNKIAPCSSAHYLNHSFVMSSRS